MSDVMPTNRIEERFVVVKYLQTDRQVWQDSMGNHTLYVSVPAIRGYVVDSIVLAARDYPLGTVVVKYMGYDIHTYGDDA